MKKLFHFLSTLTSYFAAGYEAPKLRQIAENVAAAGFYVVVPDFFYGDPYLPDMEISSWFLNHLPFADLKAKEASAVGAAGFCWGGAVHSWPMGRFGLYIIRFCFSTLGKDKCFT
ncbi:putative alpha/Beta hydrolase [Helianthus anomalus]